jgi:tetratricopeptide (TPR) repeat protein
MKKFIFIALFFLFNLSVYAVEDGFDLYVQKKYEAAFDVFNRNFVSTDGDPLYAYNLGVTSNALNKKGEALYFYLQALQMAPGFSEAHNNLDIVAKELNVVIPEKLLEPVYAVDYILIVFLVSLYAFSILLSILFFRNDWRIKTALLPVFLIMSVCAILYFIKYQEENSNIWAVVIEGSSMKSGPDDSLKEISKVKEGEIINIVTSSGSWYKVKSFQDNIEGWVKIDNIREIMRGHI